jgi:hypothetical protein
MTGNESTPKPRLWALTCHARVEIAHITSDEDMNGVMEFRSWCDRAAFKFDAKRLKVGSLDRVAEGPRVDVPSVSLVDAPYKAMLGDELSWAQRYPA